MIALAVASPASRSPARWVVISSSDGLASSSLNGMQPISSIPCCARPWPSTSGRSGLASTFTLLTTAPSTRTRCRSNRAWLSTISSIGRPTPPSLTITTGASSISATRALDRPMTAPTPAWPVPSISTTSLSCETFAAARVTAAARSSVTRPIT